jgi:hypothetical protein
MSMTVVAFLHGDHPSLLTFRKVKLKHVSSKEEIKIRKNAGMRLEKLRQPE